MKHWPLHKAYFWETAPFFRILLPVIAGILIYTSFGQETQYGFIPRFIFILTVVAFLSLIILELLKKSSEHIRIARFFLINIILVFTSWSVCWFNDVRNDPAWFGNVEKDKGDLFYIASIDGYPVEKDQTWKLSLSLLGTRQGNKIKSVNGRAFIYAYKNGHPLPFGRGDTIMIPGTWREIKNPGNPFEFDYAKYCARNNLYYLQFLPIHKILTLAGSNGNNKTILETCHDWCMQQLERYIPDAGTKGLIQAMLIGDEINLDEQIRTSYTETGIVHIIAISGGNVSIFFFVVSYLLWWIRHKKYNWIKYLTALPLVWFYVLMAGAAPSAVRAALMFSILAIGFILQKKSTGLNQLLATAAVLLLAEPMWLFSVGFQLSFIAVLSLILFYQPIYKLFSPGGKISKALWSTVYASLAAEILVAPLVIYYFHLFPLLFIIANVAAFIFMSVALILAMALVALSFIPAIAKILGIVTMWLVIHFNRAVLWLQGLNPLSFHFLRLNSLELILLYLCLTSLAIFILRKVKNTLFIGMATSCFLMFLFCYDEWTALQQRRLVVYNISKITHVELIEGKYHSVLNTDSIIPGNKKQYALKPAHTNWMAWKNANSPSSEIFLLGDKKVLVLNTPINTADHFPIDYLIITFPVKKMNPAQILSVFSPRIIVLGNNNTRKTAGKWFTNCYEKNITLHNLNFSGAFVSE